MSVIAWDGKVLAADRQYICGDTISTAKKIFKLSNGEVLAFCGDLDTGMTMKRWYESGHKIEDWPVDIQNDKDKWCRIIIANPLKIFYFERTPDPVEILDDFMAFGCGREVALGAMAMGATAVQAVQVASRFVIGVGNGVEAFTVRS